MTRTIDDLRDHYRSLDASAPASRLVVVRAMAEARHDRRRRTRVALAVAVGCVVASLGATAAVRAGVVPESVMSFASRMVGGDGGGTYDPVPGTWRTLTTERVPGGAVMSLQVAEGTHHGFCAHIVDGPGRDPLGIGGAHEVLSVCDGGLSADELDRFGRPAGDSTGVLMSGGHRTPGVSYAIVRAPGAATVRLRLEGRVQGPYPVKEGWAFVVFTPRTVHDPDPLLVGYDDAGRRVARARVVLDR